MDSKQQQQQKRLLEEREARELRKQAQSYLEKHSCGPSLGEQERNKKHQLIGSSSSSSATIAITGRPQQLTDNTLELIAQQEERRRQKRQKGHASYSARTEDSGPWKRLIDPDTQQVYFWNQETQETTWDDPNSTVAVEKKATKDDAGVAAEVLPSGWQAVIDPESKETYYWNQESGETSWDRPKYAAVSIEHAIEMKNKLDAILAPKHK